MRRQLLRPTLPDLPVPDWDSLAAALASFLAGVASAAGSAD